MSTFGEAEGRTPYRYERSAHGVVGSIDFIGERLVCHMCGRDFLALDTHVFRTHGVTAFEYKRSFGLMRSTPLRSSRLVERARATAIANELGPRYHATRERMTEIRPLGTAAIRHDPRLQRHVHGITISQQLARRRWKSPPGPLDHCPKGHPWDGFKTMGGRRKGQQRRCRQCNRATVQRWREENPEKFKEQRAKWRAKRKVPPLDSQIPTG